MPTILPIIDACNQNCLFCSSKGRRSNTSKAFFASAIAKAKDGIVITGGEPTMSKNLFWVIAKARRKNLSVELQSNGLSFSYEGLANELMQAGIQLININFPSHIPRKSDTLTNTPGSFFSRIAGIANLNKLKAKVRLTHVITSFNYKDLGSFVRFIAGRLSCISFVQFSFLKISGNVLKNKWLIPTYEEVQPYMIDHIPLCYLGRYMRNHADYSKLKQGLKPEYSMKEKLKLRACISCSTKSFCCGVRKDYLARFGEKNITLLSAKIKESDAG